MTSKGEASLKSAATAMEGVGAAAKKADAAFNTWTNSQQRAAIRMEAMHSAAMKMNEGFASSDDKAERLKQTMSTLSSTATASASALGLPVGQLTALNAASDVLGLGFGKLTSTMVGFNAASIGVAGAGLAIGISLGGLIRMLPGVADAMDKAALSALEFFGILNRSTGPATTNIAAMGAIAAKVQQNVVDLLRSQGKSTDEIIDHITGKTKTATDLMVESLRKQDEAQKKSAEATKKAKDALEEWELQHAKAVTQAQKDWLEKEAKDAEAAAKAIKEYDAALAEVIHSIDMLAKKTTGDYWKSEEQKASDAAKRMMENIQKGKQAEQDALDEMAQQADGLVTVVGAVTDAFAEMGVSAESNFGTVLKGLNEWAGGLSEFAHGMASGNPFEMISGSIHVLIGQFHVLQGVWKSLFGDKEWERVNDMRDEFVKAAGGIEALDKRARHAGLTVDRLLDAKKVKDYQAAIDELTDAFAAQEEAEQKVRDAMERYGITIDQMGPKWAQQELDKQAMQLFEDYQLLIAAGADHNAVIEKMGPSLNTYVQEAIKAGATIPESMRSILQAMIDAGTLTDEFGNKLTDLSGINFTQTLTEGINDAVKAIDRLVKALERIYGLPPIDIPVTVGGGTTTPSPPPHVPQFASGGFMSHTGMAFLHAGETVVPAGGFQLDPIGPGGYGIGGWQVDPLGSGGGGGSTFRGGPAGRGGSMRSGSSVAVHLAPTITVNGGSGNPNQVARAVTIALRDNLEGLGTAIGRKARAELGRR